MLLNHNSIRNYKVEKCILCGEMLEWWIIIDSAAAVIMKFKSTKENESAANYTADANATLIFRITWLPMNAEKEKKKLKFKFFLTYLLCH